MSFLPLDIPYPERNGGTKVEYLCIDSTEANLSLLKARGYTNISLGDEDYHSIRVRSDGHKPYLLRTSKREHIGTPGDYHYIVPQSVMDSFLKTKGQKLMERLKEVQCLT